MSDRIRLDSKRTTISFKWMEYHQPPALQTQPRSQGLFPSLGVGKVPGNEVASNALVYRLSNHTWVLPYYEVRSAQRE